MKSKKVINRISWAWVLFVGVLAGSLLTSCFLFSSGGDSQSVDPQIVSDIESNYLITHKLLQGEKSKSLGSIPRTLTVNPLTPFSTPIGSSSSLISKATVNRTGATTGFSDGGPLANYPEPGQTTSWKVTLYDVVNRIYKVTVTTTYPTNSPAEYTIEEYYVKDISPGPGPADGIWNEHDLIVDGNGNQNQAYRIQYYTRFRDGSIRSEKILMSTGQKDGVLGIWTPDGFAADPSNTYRYASFDINGSLDYPAVFSPTPSDTAEYSSIVLYTHIRSNTLSYWFWEGTRMQNTVGIRYYTEHKNVNGAYIYGTTLVFEKTLDTFLTLGGSLAKSLADIYVGGSNDALAKTVIRNEVKFDNKLNAFSKTTRSKVTVYDVTGNKTLYVQKLNDDAASGNLFTEDELTGDIYIRTTIRNNEPYGLPLVVDNPPSGDLGTLYASIENGAATTTDSKTGATAYEFNGQQGIVNPDTTNSDYDLTTEGTIEAWVKLYDKIPWAAIVHKGVKDDFSDEVYSLQFWSVGNDVTFVLNPVSGSYLLVQAGNPYKNLQLNTWYYIVATWSNKPSTRYIDLYINGQRVGRKTNSFYRTDGTPNPGVKENDAPVVIGAQFATSSPVYKGYFGLKGIIDGWKVHKEYWDATKVLSKYQNSVS